jgi:RimJ/RimL family protein N-acetyltransferase
MKAESVAHLFELEAREAARFCRVQGRRHSISRLMLTCFEANTAAKALYAKLGYVVCPSSPNPEVDGPECAGYALQQPISK